MVNGYGTCQQPLHSCLGDRCQRQEEKSALLGLWVLVPLLPIDLPTWKGERGPVHLRAGPSPWACFTRFNSGCIVYRTSVCSLLEEPLVLQPQGAGTPSSTGSLVSSLFPEPGPRLQAPCSTSPPPSPQGFYHVHCSHEGEFDPFPLNSDVCSLKREIWWALRPPYPRAPGSELDSAGSGSQEGDSVVVKIRFQLVIGREA